LPSGIKKWQNEKWGVVHTGKAEQPVDIVEAIRRSREERTRKHAGGGIVASDE
jgi:hypothetical protein